MFRVGLLILVVATAAWRWWTISHWSWFADDWIYLYETQEQGFLAYVFQGYNSHLMPGQFLVVWLITSVQPLGFGLAAGVLTAFAVASVIAWAAALREIFGEKVQLLLPLLLIALSPLLLMPTVWFASGVQVLPLQLFMGLSVLFTARYALRGHRRSDAVWLLVSFAAGLFFWEKALLVMIPVAFVGYLLVEGAPVARLRRLVPVLAAPTVLAAVYTVVYLTTRRSGAIGIQTTQFAPRSFDEWWEFMTASMRNIGLTTIAGGPFETMQDAWDNYVPISSALATSLGVALVLFLVVSLVLRRGSALAIAMTAVYLLVSWGLVLSSDRYVDTLLVAAGTGRYATDILPVAALTLAFLTAQTRSANQTSQVRRAPSPRVVEGGRLVMQMVAACVALAIVVMNALGWAAAREQSPRPWVDAIVADSKRAGDATLVSTPPPPTVIHPVLFLANAQLPKMLKPLDLPLSFDRPSQQLLAADGSGHLREAEVVNYAAKNKPTDNPDCGFLVRPGRTTRVPMTIDLYGFAWAVRLDYFAEQPTSITVSTDTVDVDLDLQQGLRLMQFGVNDSISSFEVSAPADASPVCVTQVFVGSFGASDRSPFQQ
jgi:hypothetical protein